MKERKNSTLYVRESHDKKYHYSTVSNSLTNDKRLNATEKGLMLMILSNGVNYVFNSTYLQKESKLGQVVYFKAIKHLQELGYIIKKRLVDGGVKWVIIETREIIQDLQVLGYLTLDFGNNTWTIDESKYSTFQLIDFHLTVDNQNMGNQNMDNQIMDNQIMDNQNMDNQIMEFNSLISTNQTNTNKPSTEVIKKEEINKNETSKNEPLVIEKNLESLSLSITEVKIENVGNIIEPTSITNDLELVLNEVPHFNYIYYHSEAYLSYDISKYSNALIAYNAFKYNTSTEKEKEEMMKLDKTLGLQHYITKYSLRIPQSNLKKEYEHHCKENDRLDLLER